MFRRTGKGVKAIKALEILRTQKKCVSVVYPSKKLATLVQGEPMATFSIATTPKYRGGRNSFPWIAPLNEMKKAHKKRIRQSESVKTFQSFSDCRS